MTRILVVEDSPTQAEHVRLILEGEGLEVVTACDGQEGKEELAASTFDLVVSDILMPRVSGYELCRWMKSAEGTRNIPVVLLTTLNDPMDIIQALEAGADNFISKPYEAEYLVAHVRDILETRRLRPQGKLSVNVEMLFMGRRFTIGSGKEQILGLLLSAFEDMVRTNSELRATQAELAAAKEELEKHALKLESRAQTSEEMYRTIVNTAVEGVWALDAEARTKFVNERMAAMLGYSPEEMLGHSMFEFVDEKSRSAAMESFKQQEAGLRKERDFSFRRKDGSIIWTRLSTSHTFGSRGEPTGGIGLVSDVTDRRKTEASLRETRSALEQAEALAHIGSWRSDPAHPGMVIWSAEMFRIFGLQADGFDGRFETFMSMVHPEDLPALREADAASWREGQPLSIDHRIVRPDGTVRWIHDSADVVRDASGKVVELVGIAQDFTDLRSATDRLRESEERYRVLFEASPLPMWLFDPANLAFVVVNQAAVDHYGYSAEEFSALTLRDIRPAEDVERFERSVGRKASNEAKEWRHRTKDGRIIDVNVHVSDVSAHGKTLRLAILLDVTREKSLEAQFRQSQKLEAVGRLAAGVAHDFNNILTVIGGYGEALARGLPEGEALHRDALEIGLAARRGAALTRQLLTFSRKQVLEPMVLDVNTIVRGALGLLGRLLGEDIEIVVKLQDGLDLVKADPGQLEQVIMNLAVNGRDAMPEGGKLILETQLVELDEAYVRAHASVAAGPYVLLAVSDTGCGMTPETVSHIFEPFFTTKEEGKGTGLGLPTVFGIVKQCGGEIRVYSVPGEGTTVKVYIPVTSAVIEEREVVASPTTVRARPGETVLLVEDDETVGRLTRSMLGDLGYEVLAATRGEEALEIAARHPGPIHVLLTDVVMPGPRGPELATRLRALRPQTRVVFMSGYAREAVVHQAAIKGAGVFMQKPFTFSTLGRKLREALDTVGGDQDVRVHPDRSGLSILHMDDDTNILEITRFFLGEDGHRVVSCFDVDETVTRYAEALARGERFDLVLLDLTIPGKRGGVEAMREILKLDPTAKIVACSGAGGPEAGPLEGGFVGIVEKPFTSESLKAIAHLL